MSKINLHKLKPSKDNVYQFIFNALLIIITILAGFHFVDSRIATINQNWSERREWVEKKNDFVETFALVGQSRIYLGENYYFNSISGESISKLDSSWEAYMVSVADWNKRNLLNPIFIEYYFDQELKNRYNDSLVPKMRNLHLALLDIREGKSVPEIENTIEEAKHELFIFSEKLMDQPAGN